MASSVVESVARTLGLTPDQGQVVVQLLVKHLHSQVSPSRAVTIPELGLFYRTGDQMGFRADPALNQAAGTAAAPPDTLIIEYEQGSTRNWLKPMLIVVGAVLIVAVGYWGFVQMQSISEPPVSEIVLPVDTALTEVRLVTAQDSLADLDLQAAETSVPRAETTATTLPPAVRGTFTLVVAALANDSDAQTTAAKFRSQLAPWPVDVVPSEDGLWYRVTVGRAESAAAIAELRSQLADLPEDAWTLELK